MTIRRSSSNNPSSNPSSPSALAAICNLRWSRPLGHRKEIGDRSWAKPGWKKLENCSQSLGKAFGNALPEAVPLFRPDAGVLALTAAFTPMRPCAPGARPGSSGDRSRPPRRPTSGESIPTPYCTKPRTPNPLQHERAPPKCPPANTWPSQKTFSHPITSLRGDSPATIAALSMQQIFHRTMHALLERAGYRQESLEDAIHARSKPNSDSERERQTPSR